MNIESYRKVYIWAYIGFLPITLHPMFSELEVFVLRFHPYICTSVSHNLFSCFEIFQMAKNKIKWWKENDKKGT